MARTARSHAAAVPAAPGAGGRGVRLARLAGVSVLVLLGACATRAPAPLERDGPGAQTPPGLERVPDAEPRVEALRVGGPNKPYEIFGRSYTPLRADLPLRETGLASWYGRKFHGQPTSNGETYDMYAMTAAHKTMPLPSYARVRNLANGREVIVRVNDRGPFVEGRVIDLSYTAALKLGALRGVTPVEVERLTHDEIRSGAWRGTRLPPDDPAPGEPFAAGAGFWLQLGAFRQREGALSLQQHVVQNLVEGGWLQVGVLEVAGLYRVQAGPFASRADAQQAGERLRAPLGLQPLVIERN